MMMLKFIKCGYDDEVGNDDIAMMNGNYEIISIMMMMMMQWK